jgi:hypothetical protein
MASNDPEPAEPEQPSTGPVAFLTRIVHAPSDTQQTPLRVACVIVLALVLAATPLPWNAIGYGILVVLALSLGRINP